MRARQVVFAARIGAGRRGASNIEIDDFLCGLIMEDQYMVEGLLKDLFPEMPQGETNVIRSEVEGHTPFFVPEIASELLLQIGNLLPQSTPISASVEIPLSPDLKTVFDEADDLRKTLHHSRVEPLHLLTTTLSKASSEGVSALQRAGITKDGCLGALRAFPAGS
jgi:hypothetical protein